MGAADTSADERVIHQIVYRYRSGSGMVPMDYTMPARVCEEFIRFLNLGRFTHADPELTGCVDLHYSLHGERAVLVYRKSVVEETRDTSLAHVLIGRPRVLSPGNVVPMLTRWPWSTDREQPSNQLKPISVDEFTGMAQNIGQHAAVEPRSPELNRLIIESVLQGPQNDLVVKAGPGSRAVLIRGLYQTLGEVPLLRGFSFHETDYDDAQSLPGLSFISERTQGYLAVSRRVVDLEAPSPGVPRTLHNLADRIIDASKRNRVADWLNIQVEGLQSALTYGQLLGQCGFAPPHVRALPAPEPLPATKPPSPPRPQPRQTERASPPTWSAPLAEAPAKAGDEQIDDAIKRDSSGSVPTEPTETPQRNGSEPANQPPDTTTDPIIPADPADLQPDIERRRVEPPSPPQPKPSYEEPRGFDPLDAIPFFLLLLVVLALAAVIMVLGRTR